MFFFLKIHLFFSEREHESRGGEGDREGESFFFFS